MDDEAPTRLIEKARLYMDQLQAQQQAAKERLDSAVEELESSKEEVVGLEEEMVRVRQTVSCLTTSLEELQAQGAVNSAEPSADILLEQMQALEAEETSLREAQADAEQRIETLGCLELQGQGCIATEQIAALTEPLRAPEKENSSLIEKLKEKLKEAVVER